MTKNHDERRLYGDLAWIWNLMGSPNDEDYIEEAEQFLTVIQQNSRIEAKSLLDLGCGGGKNDYNLKNYFEITGVDISEPMLALAKQLNPEVEYLTGDMRTVRLNKTFAAVKIGDSLWYMLTEADLRAAFVTAFEHLKPGGVFCTYAELTRERFQQNRTDCSTYHHDNIDIAFVSNNYDPDSTDTTVESVLIWLIRRDGKLEMYTDHHLGGIFPLQTWLDLLKDVGFEVALIEAQWHDPMFICIKP